VLDCVAMRVMVGEIRDMVLREMFHGGAWRNGGEVWWL